MSISHNENMIVKSYCEFPWELTAANTTRKFSLDFVRLKRVFSLFPISPEPLL